MELAAPPNSPSAPWLHAQRLCKMLSNLDESLVPDPVAAVLELSQQWHDARPQLGLEGKRALDDFRAAAAAGTPPDIAPLRDALLGEQVARQVASAYRSSWAHHISGINTAFAASGDELVERLRDIATQSWDVMTECLVSLRPVPDSAALIDHPALIADFHALTGAVGRFISARSCRVQLNRIPGYSVDAPESIVLYEMPTGERDKLPHEPLARYRELHSRCKIQCWWVPTKADLEGALRGIEEQQRADREQHIRLAVR